MKNNKDVQKNTFTDKISSGYILSAIKLDIDSNPNVYGLSEPFIDSVQRKIFKTQKSDPGIKIAKTEEGYVIDLFLIVYYEVEIPKLAWELQAQIKNTLQARVGIKVSKINIHIQGVMTR